MSKGTYMMQRQGLESLKMDVIEMTVQYQASKRVNRKGPVRGKRLDW